MGTRSITVVNNYSGVPIINLYRQFDGYLDGHGKKLADFLASGKLTNGIRFGENSGVFNGPDCLAAQLVAHFKKEPGGFYLRPPVSKPDEEYVYIVHTDQSFQILLEVLHLGERLGVIPPEEFDTQLLEWLSEDEGLT